MADAFLMGIEALECREPSYYHAIASASAPAPAHVPVPVLIRVETQAHDLMRLPIIDTLHHPQIH